MHLIQCKLQFWRIIADCVPVCPPRRSKISIHDEATPGRFVKGRGDHAQTRENRKMAITCALQTGRYHVPWTRGNSENQFPCIGTSHHIKAEELEIILHAGLGDPPVYQPAVLCEVFDRMLGIIVVPRNAVVIEECEKFAPILCHALA
jgi:hypothetical protein